MFENLWNTMTTNPVFAGVAGGGIVTALVVQAREVPHKIFRYAKSAFTVELEVENDQRMFDHLCMYLGKISKNRSVRRLKLTQMYDDEAEKWSWAMAHGTGFHWFRDEGSFFFLSRGAPEGVEGGGMEYRRREILKITVMGRDVAPIKALLERAEKVEHVENTVAIHGWRYGGFKLLDQRPMRQLRTVFLPREQTDRIVQDLEKFLSNKDRYRDLGTPYRRGILLSGPAGTGKTSLILALASHFEKSLNVISLASIKNDSELADAFNAVKSDSFVAVEDVDTVKVSHLREEQETKGEGKASGTEGVTLGGLLNALDGLSSREGRVVFMTTNRPDKLDDALVRQGRIDRHETISELGPAEARRMTEHFVGERWPQVYEAIVKPLLPAPACEVQEVLLRESDLI